MSCNQLPLTTSFRNVNPSNQTSSSLVSSSPETPRLKHRRLRRMGTPASAASVHGVFVYGTLLDDEVAKAVIKRLPSSSPATLDNYHRYNVKGRVYPAIVPAESKKVAGKVLLGITDIELNVLDTYEDDEYERMVVEVRRTDNMENLSVYAYIWKNRNDPNLHGDWSFDEWKQRHFKDYLEMTFGFMEDLENMNSDN